MIDTGAILTINPNKKYINRSTTHKNAHLALPDKRSTSEESVIFDGNTVLVVKSLNKKRTLEQSNSITNPIFPDEKSHISERKRRILNESTLFIPNDNILLPKAQFATFIFAED